jgi:hypothetical protein
MVKILVLVGSDNHSYRLLNGLSMIPNLEIHANPLKKNREHDPDVNEPSKIARQNFIDFAFESNCYDIAFVDSTYEGDTDKIKSDVFLLYDCNDRPNAPIYEGKLGRAYYDLKDKALAYATFSCIEGETFEDGLKRIAFPITPYLFLNQVSKSPTSPWSNFNSVPHLYAAPTQLYGHDTLTEDNFTSIDEEDRVIFNQRYKWLYELEEYNIPYDGGIVFPSEDDTSHNALSYQEKHFPGIGKFSRQRHGYKESLLKLLTQFKVGLCPAGHQRNSWRLFDLMSTGSIIYKTDTKHKFLYEPKHQWIVKDDDHLGDIYLRDIKEFKEMYKASQDNREVLSKLTPEIIWKDFKNQM